MLDDQNQSKSIYLGETLCIKIKKLKIATVHFAKKRLSGDYLRHDKNNKNKNANKLNEK